jgi:hypothetical protein
MRGLDPNRGIVAPRGKWYKYVKIRFYCGFKNNYGGKSYNNGADIVLT